MNISLNMPNRYFEQINKEFPHNAHSTYFFLIYGYLYLQQPGPFIRYLAKINKELPDTYAALGVDETHSFPTSYSTKRYA